MDKGLIEALTKAGAAVIIALLLAMSMYFGHKERSANDARLHDLMERQTAALEKIQRVYSGEGG